MKTLRYNNTTDNRKGKSLKKVVPIVTLLLSVNLIASSLFLDRFFNDKECDQILRNDGYFKTCYDYDAKGANGKRQDRRTVGFLEDDLQ